MMVKRRLLGVCVATLLGCSSASPPAESGQAASAQGSEQTAPAPGFGGRLFDSFASELKLDFVPDDPSTPELDGKGGPFGNGTLPDAQGNPLANSGHDYRLKNLFGWDLRGGDGIYGTRYKNKSHVLLPDLLKNSDPRETWIARLEAGEDAIPAYGKVMTHEQIESVVDFLLAVRDGKLPRPDEIFTLSEGTPGNYQLVSGGDAERGHAHFAKTCAQCHGADGAAFPLDGGEHSLGTLMRSAAYESWLKVLNGQPGTGMHSQVPQGASREELAQLLRDLNAATCDRTRYPKGQASEDVPDGDPRCGSYLK
jgi:mono/diheme cytochrome c family protein